MTKPLQPGPYWTPSGYIVVVLGGSTDHEGWVRVIKGVVPHMEDGWLPEDLTPADRWPGWWPWPDMPLPQRQIQIGDFVSRDGARYAMKVLGRFAGKVQYVYEDGSTNASLPDVLFIVDRPHDWPEDDA